MGRADENGGKDRAGVTSLRSSEEGRFLSYRMDLHPASWPSLRALPSVHTQSPTACHPHCIRYGPSHHQPGLSVAVGLAGLLTQALASLQCVLKTVAAILFNKLDELLCCSKSPQELPLVEGEPNVYRVVHRRPSEFASVSSFAFLPSRAAVCVSAP